MALAFDAAGNLTGTGAGPFTASFTTSGSNRLLVAGVSYYHFLNTVSAITYNGVGLTEIPGSALDSGDYHVRLYGLAAPASGSNTFSITFSGTGVYDAGIGLVSFTGAHQTVSFGTPVMASGTDTTPTVSVPSAADELVLDTTIINHSGTYAVGAGQTSRWNAISSNGYLKYSGSTETGAGPTVMSWSNTTIQPWIIAAVPIKPVAAGGGSAVPVYMNHRRNQGMT